MSEFVALYRELAAGGKNFFGLSLLTRADEIGALIERTGARTILDYGSGRGDGYLPPHEVHKVWGVERPTLYDPAFPEHDVLPPAGVLFDGVICSDVLEHVPVREVDQVIDELFDFATKFVWCSYCSRPAKKLFPDGRNMHVTQKPPEWWERRFKDAQERDGRQIPFHLIQTP